MKKDTVEEFKAKLFKIHGDTAAVDESTYKNHRTKAKFLDKEHGEWWAIPNNVLRGRLHPARKQERTKATCANRYGVSSPFNVKSARNKTLEHTKLTLEEVQKMLSNKYGDLVTIKPATYAGTRSRSVFVDKEFGEWEAIVTNVLHCGRSHPERGKIKKKEAQEKTDWASARVKAKITNLQKYGFGCAFEDKERMRKIMLEKYGVEHCNQNLKIALKAAKNSNNIHILAHWKGGAELICKGSYEKRVVEHLNKNKVNYQWQPEFFSMPDGRKYLPDMFLVDDNLWVEIKGYFRKDAKEKWDWFHKEHPNSELWDERKLRSMKII